MLAYPSLNSVLLRELLELLLRSQGEIVEGGFVVELQKEINIERRAPKGADKKVALQGLFEKKLNSTRSLDELKKQLASIRAQQTKFR